MKPNHQVKGNNILDLAKRLPEGAGLRVWHCGLQREHLGSRSKWTELKETVSKINKLSKQGEGNGKLLGDDNEMSLKVSLTERTRKDLSG